MKVSVLGAGNGGFALSFHLVQRGHEVLLFELNQFKKALEGVEKTGEIVAVKESLEKEAEISGTSSITKTTSDIKEAMAFGDFIMLIVPSYGQGRIFEMALPFLTEKHVFISLPGNFCIMEFAEIVKKHSNLDDNVTLGDIPMPCTFVEVSTIPYACRRLEDNEVFIGGLKKQMEVGVFPSVKTKEVLDMIRPLTGVPLIECSNVFEAGFYNLNVLLHPPITIFNAGWIEATEGNFLFYLEGCTEAVANGILGLDKERRELAKSFGYDLRDVLTCWKEWYGDTTSKTLREFAKNAKHYQNIKAPASLNNRYVTEDLTYMLRPMVTHLASVANVDMPFSTAIIVSAEVLTGLPIKSARNFDVLLKNRDSLESLKLRL